MSGERSYVATSSIRRHLPGHKLATYGNTGRNQFRGPGYFNMNLSVSRTFKFTERVSMDVRADAFGFTNTPHFANPNTGCPGSAVGATLRYRQHIGTQQLWTLPTRFRLAASSAGSRYPDHLVLSLGEVLAISADWVAGLLPVRNFLLLRKTDPEPECIESSELEYLRLATCSTFLRCPRALLLGFWRDAGNKAKRPSCRHEG